MKVLVLTYHIDNREGGSARFMNTVADTLIEMGYEVVLSTDPEAHVEEEFDLIICSHLLHRIESNPAPKIVISHGIVASENLYPGAQKYISVSEETKARNLENGIFSEVVPQPIQIPVEVVGPKPDLENILVIRRHENEPCPFAFLDEIYELRYSDMSIPIEEQIKWADLCITLGRGALESMSYARPVIVADNRDYMGAIGDGYVDLDNIIEISKCNFSGRRYKIPITREWVEGEIAKYNHDDGARLYGYVNERHEATKVVSQYLKMVSNPRVGTVPGLISIIIPVWNQHEMSQDCIQMVMETTEDYEVVVVDNGSDPPFEPPFSGFNEVRVIRNEENKGYPVAANQGVRESKGEYVVLLNNDVVVTDGAINRLVGHLSEDLDIVGPITNYCAGLQNMEVPVYHNRDELEAIAEEVFESAEGGLAEVNWVIGFCMALKRELYDELQPFDESLWPSSGEEIDFCYRAKKAGHSIAIALDTFVHHEGSISFRDLQNNQDLDYVKLCKRNDAHLAGRWGVDVFSDQEILVLRERSHENK